ncbi:MAG: SPOR domain-containing protein [Alphaproteobacteria bacterium]
MSKSYFERRIFGESDQAENDQNNAPSLGSLKSEGSGAPSQPYRFGASRRVSRPVISAPVSEQVPSQAEADEHAWEASSELRARLGMHAKPSAAAEASSQWEAQTAEPIDFEQRAAEQERLMDDLTGYHSADDPYPLGAPQPSMMEEEASFGFHGVATEPEPSMEAAPVATTGTHAVGQFAAPESAVTEPRMAHASAVGLGGRVNLSDPRAGTSVQPDHYVSAESPQPASAAAAKRTTAHNPLARAAIHREQQSTTSAPRKPAPIRKETRGTSALPPRAPQRKRKKSGGALLFIRNGLMAVVMLLGLGLLMSVSYAAFKGLGQSVPEDVAVLLAPDEPIKLRPDDAGIDPNVAAGRMFEADLTVLSNPRGVLEPSDDRYARDASDAPTMTMNFGGQSLIVAEIDTAQPPVVLDPINELAPNDNATVAAIPVAATESVTELQAIPAVEEPLADASPLANGLIDVIPKTRGSVPTSYQGFAMTIQASAETTVANTTTAEPSLTTPVVGQRGSTTQTATLDPASGLPTTPQSPGLSGAAVITPFGIQLASLRTEQQAKVLWERLQDKYPELLGGLSSRIVKFDSTSRGIFYRLQAGPMPTKITAVDFCVKLKVAGQECFFVRG